MGASDRLAPEGTGNDGSFEDTACGVLIVSNGMSAILCIWYLPT